MKEKPEKEYVYVYVYNKKGIHSPALKIEKDIKQIANIIIKTENSPRIIITDLLDNFILDTMYGYIDICGDKKLLKEILKVLIPMQETEYGRQKQPGEVKIINIENYINLNKLLMKNFNVTI